jgi:hypothetical protein
MKFVADPTSPHKAFCVLLTLACAAVEFSVGVFLGVGVSAVWEIVCVCVWSLCFLCVCGFRASLFVKVRRLLLGAACSEGTSHLLVVDLTGFISGVICFILR